MGVCNVTLNNGFPQRGLLTTVENGRGRVYLPLAGFETDLFDATVPLAADMEGKDVLVVFVNGDRNQGVITGVILTDE
jgi:hypothetical protein